MAVKRICKYPEPILRQKTKPVDFAASAKKLPAIIEDLWDTCCAVSGVGLAANQIGLNMRLAVVAVRQGDAIKRLVLINPVITAKDGAKFEEEGCLSFPGIFADVKRFAKVKVEALNEKGILVEITAEGFIAKALQHEIDHLDGKVFIDRLPPISKIKIKLSLRKLAKEWAKLDESKPKNENSVSGHSAARG